MSTTLSKPVASFETVHASCDPIFGVLQDWLCNYIGEIFGTAPDQVDSRTKFRRFGLDSSTEVGMVGDLAAWLGCELSTGLTYDFPTIAKLAAALAQREDIRAAVRGQTKSPPSSSAQIVTACASAGADAN